MNTIKIQSSTEQSATCEQLDRIAHDYLDVQTSLDDESHGCREGAEIKLPSNITASDGCYSDTQDAFEKQLGVTITSNASYQRILDPAVLSVLKANMDASAISDGKILHAPFAALTSVSTWFKGNADIVSFKELASSGVKTLTGSGSGTSLNGAFKGCTSLKEIDLSSIETIQQGVFYLCTSLPKAMNLPSLTSINFVAFGDNCNSTSVRCWFMPKVKTISYIGKQTYEGKVADIGESIESFSSYSFYSTRGLDNLIIRKKSLVAAPTTNLAQPATNIFVPSDLVDTYKSADNWSTYADKIFPIGGTEWQTAMSGLSKEEGWNEEGVPEEYQENVYSYPYVDYLIYGLNPPGGN